MARNTKKYAYHEVAIRRDSPGYKRLLAEAQKRGYIEVGKLLNLILPGLLEEVPDLWHPAAPKASQPTDDQPVSHTEEERHQASDDPLENPAARTFASNLGLLEDE
jgi:hypothetical protein